MTLITLIFVCLLLSYLLGSVPVAVWVGQGWFGIDVRDYGSGNAGATNTFRVLGRNAGLVVLILDVFKGWTAALLPLLLIMYDILPAEKRMLFQLSFGMMAVFGHIYPIFAGFKGGKGVATLLGVAFCSAPIHALLCVVVFIIVFALTHYVSLGSMFAALAFPLLCLWPPLSDSEPAVVYIGFFIFIGLVFTHRTNVKKLIAGTENKTWPSKKNKT